MIHFTNFMNFDFIFKFFLFQCSKIYTLKLIIALNFSLLCYDICFHSFFFRPSLRRIPIQRMWIARLIQFVGKQFFSISIWGKRMFCLPNKFFLFTNHKQPLKCVWQNSYLDLWSNTLYIIWQGVHLSVKLQVRGTN